MLLDAVAGWSKDVLKCTQMYPLYMSSMSSILSGAYQERKGREGNTRRRSWAGLSG